MSFTPQHLYDLLPAILRIRDAEQGEPLKALVSVIAEHVAVLEENLEQLYDDQFIETCADWVIPYIGDLIGYRALHGVAPTLSSPRAEVGHTIAFRRRKGTAAMLEQVARDVTGWNARVVEFFQLLATTQYMNHVRLGNYYAPDLRQWEPLERLHTPFDSVAHTVDVRRIVSGRGLYNIPNIGIFLWRLNAYSLTGSPAFRVDDRRFLFSPLGNDMPLYTRPETEDDLTHLAEPINVPLPLSRRVLHHSLQRYYGPGKSLVLQGLDTNAIVVCNLSDSGGGNWAHQPPAGKIAIDPVLGRIAFADAQSAPPLVTFHSGFSADLGGGEYERASSFTQPVAGLPLLRVPQDHSTIQAALNTVAPTGGVVEITDSGRYQETLQIDTGAQRALELRAANEHRPTLVLGGDLRVTGGADTEVTLNGLLISGGTLRVPAGANNALRRLRLRHCTLVPGRSLTSNGEPQQPDQPSVIVELANVTVEIDHCILGGVRVVAGAQVRITDSIVDATDETRVAYADTDDFGPGGRLHIEHSTVIGKVHTLILELASNCLFLARLATGDTWTAPVRAEQKQKGCVRFSSLPWSSVVPRRYHCQPQSEGETLRVRPQFTSLRYGHSGYGQLHQRCADEIRRGADDEAEMGAFHSLYQPQREINLRVRLDEYLRVGLEAGIFYAT